MRRKEIQLLWKALECKTDITTEHDNSGLMCPPAESMLQALGESLLQPFMESLLHTLAGMFLGKITRRLGS
jgi:hypothetical protein